jgi:ribosomal protein S8
MESNANNAGVLKEVLSEIASDIKGHVEYLLYSQNKESFWRNKHIREQLNRELKTLSECDEKINRIYDNSSLNIETLVGLLDVLEKNGYLSSYNNTDIYKA